MQLKDIPDSEIIRACNDFHAGRAETPDVALANKYTPKLILAKMRKLADRGVLDYGVSLRTAWVERSIS